MVFARSKHPTSQALHRLKFCIAMSDEGTARWAAARARNASDL